MTEQLKDLERRLAEATGPFTYTYPEILGAYDAACAAYARKAPDGTCHLHAMAAAFQAIPREIIKVRALMQKEG